MEVWLLWIGTVGFESNVKSKIITSNLNCISLFIWFATSFINDKYKDILLIDYFTQLFAALPQSPVDLTRRSVIAIDDQQDATILAYLFIYSQSALRVSGDVFVHHQEHLTVFTASDVVHLCCCRLVLLVRGSSISSMTPAVSNMDGQYQKL